MRQTKPRRVQQLHRQQNPRIHRCRHQQPPPRSQHHRHLHQAHHLRPTQQPPRKEKQHNLRHHRHAPQPTNLLRRQPSRLPINHAISVIRRMAALNQRHRQQHPPRFRLPQQRHITQRRFLRCHRPIVQSRRRPRQLHQPMHQQQNHHQINQLLRAKLRHHPARQQRPQNIRPRAAQPRPPIIQTNLLLPSARRRLVQRHFAAIKGKKQPNQRHQQPRPANACRSRQQRRHAAPRCQPNRRQQRIQPLHPLRQQQPAQKAKQISRRHHKRNKKFRMMMALQPQRKKRLHHPKRAKITQKIQRQPSKSRNLNRRLHRTTLFTKI